MEGRLTPEDPIEALLARATLRLVGEGKGSGFFVAPGVVLSSAHVVGRSLASGAQVGIMRFDGRDGRAKLEAIDPTTDVALLSTEADAQDVAVELDDDALLGDALLLYGWPHGVATTRLATYEGGEGPPGAGRLKHLIKGAQVVGGFSGGPLLNLRTLAVIGVVAETRDERFDLGGYAVPVARLRLALPALGPLIDKVGSRREAWRAAAAARSLRIQRRLDEAAGTGSALPGAAAIAAFIARYRNIGFAGRHREFAAMDAWIEADDAPPYRLVTAPAGRGKSALVVNWLAGLAARSLPLEFVFVPISIRDRLTDEGDVLRALATRIGAAWQTPAPGFGSGTQALHDFIAATLGRTLPEGRRAVIVIDALDEATGWTFAPALLPQTPAPGVRILLTARATAEHGQADWLTSLGLEGPGRCRAQDIEKLSRDDLAAFARRIWPNFGGDSAALVQALFVITDEGDPLLLQLYTEALGADPSLLLAQGIDKGSIEQGLERFFEFWWADQERVWGQRFTRLAPAVRMVFNVLALAIGPIGRRGLLEVLRRVDPTIDGDALDEALALLSRFTVHGDGEYVLAHPRFAEHRRLRLQADGDSGKLLGAFRAWAEDSIGDTTRPIERYLVRNWILHLERDRAAPSDFRLAYEYRWQQAWDSIGDDEAGLKRDLDIAWRQFLGAARRSKAPPLAFLGDAWATAFRIAERSGVLARLDPAIAAPLLRHRVWSERRALSLVASTGADADRARALAALIPLLPESLLREAERVLSSLDTYDKHHLAPGWIALVRRIDAAEGRPAALVLARNRPAGALRASVLLALAARSATSGECSRLAADAAADQAAMNPIELSEFPALIAMAFDELPIGTRLDAAARTAAEEATFAAHGRPRFLGDLPDAVDPPRVLALVATLPWTTPEQAHILVEQALRAAARMDWVVAVQVLIKMAPFVAADQVDAALASCGEGPAFELERDGAHLLALLAPKMTAVQRQQHGQALEAFADRLAPDDNRRRQVASLRALTSAGFGASIAAATLGYSRAGSLDSRVVAVAAESLSAAQARETIDHLQAAARSGDEAARAAIGPLLVRLASFGPDDARSALQAAERLDQGLLRQAASIGVGRRVHSGGHFSELSVNLLEAVSMPASRERRRVLRCFEMAPLNLSASEADLFLNSARDDEARSFILGHLAGSRVDQSPLEADPDEWSGAPNFDDPRWPERVTEAADLAGYLTLFGRRIAQVLRAMDRARAEAIGGKIFAALRGQRLRVDTIAALAFVMPREVLDEIDIRKAGGDSSSDRTEIFASIGARRVVLGDFSDGMRWLRAAPYRDGVASHVSDAVRWAPEAALSDLAGFALERLGDEAGMALGPLAQRWSALSQDAARRLIEGWIDAVSRMPLPMVFAQLPIFVEGLEQLGGREALERVAVAI